MSPHILLVVKTFFYITGAVRSKIKYFSLHLYFTWHQACARKVMSNKIRIPHARHCPTEKTRRNGNTGLGRTENTGKSSAANCTGRKNDLSQSAEEPGLAR